MNDQYSSDKEAEQIARRLRQRQEMKRRKREQERRRRIIRKCIPLGFVTICILVLLGSGIGLLRESLKNKNKIQKAELEDSTIADVIQNMTPQPEEQTEESGGKKYAANSEKTYAAEETDSTTSFDGEILSEHAILIDTGTDTILAKRDAMSTMNPASMTKILTVLVAAENVEDLEDTFTVTTDITDYCYTNDCSAVGFADGETVTVKDLFYGTILPSGGDAALGLATYIAGSPEAFVDMMNEKLDQLGLSETAHFTNCIGVYDEAHYCTTYDMAMILRAAVDNELCREILSAHTYTTSSTAEHPDGITISNWFLRRIEDKDSGGTVLCGKTGYVVQSGNCAASYAEDSSGKGYICVTSKASSGWCCIYDHVAIYKKFMQ